MTTTTTNFESIETASLDSVIGGCKKGCSAPRQQQIINNRPMPGPVGGGDGPVDVAVDYNAQAQAQAAG